MSDLKAFSDKLYNFGKYSKNVASISTEIEVELARLDLCPLGHKDHTSILNDLAVAYEIHYDQEHSIGDIKRAIEVNQTRLDLCPLGHPEHVQALGEFVLCLGKHYWIQKKKEDLDRLIKMQERWFNLCPLGHTDHAKALGELAISTWHCYNMQQDIADLDRAIKMEEKRLELCPEGHPEHDTALINLADSLRERYRQLGDLTDLNRAMELQEESLQLCPPGHQDHGLVLRHLALSYWDHYDGTKNHSDLAMAINLFQKALYTYQAEDLLFALNIHSLATTILLSQKSSQKFHAPDALLPSLDDAFDTYRLLKKCGPAVSLYLWNAAQAWVKDAEKHNHSSVLEAYQTSLNTLDHFTSLDSSLDSRHETMQARVADLANNAFSCATRHGDFQMAVELLEQGRGILWSQLARCDISLAVLEIQDNRGRELARKFTRLSADLKKHAQHNGDRDSTDPYWLVQEEWQRVVDKIRNLDGFSRFLLSPQFDDLQRAAEYGPVIIVNASKYSCDALVVLRARAPIRVPLGCSLDDVVQLCTQLSELTQDSHAYGSHRELYVKEVLRELWSCVVERIVSVLQDDIQLPPGSRIWWYPTSKFTLLPFHAAGPHRKGKKDLMDIYISSYAPSLSALLRARDRLRSQKEARAAFGTPGAITFAAVGQAYPSKDTGLSQLPEVEHEIQRIRNETGMPEDVEFEAVAGAAASIEGAVQAFRDHRWVHVACHGAQHTEKPFDSWFAMGDGKLTLMRIIQERYMNSEFAFLSACHTAVGDASTPDEVLHLAAGMQFAGFNGVIGTLWRVDDSIAHQVVTRFYKEMFKHPVIDFEHAAAALNTAAVETADEVSLEKRIVFVHIGI